MSEETIAVLIVGGVVVGLVAILAWLIADEEKRESREQARDMYPSYLREIDRAMLEHKKNGIPPYFVDPVSGVAIKINEEKAKELKRKYS